MVSAGGNLSQTDNLTLNDGPGNDLTMDGAWNFSNGGILGAGNAVLGATGILNFTSTNNKTIAAPITSNGVINWQDGSILYNALVALTNNGTMTISGNNNLSINGPAVSKAVTYYRLQMIDKDRKYTHSAIIRLNSSTTAGDVFSILANPAQNIINISGLKEKGRVKIFDMQGRLLQQFNTSAQSLLVNVSNYKPGFYIVQYQNDKITISKKILKQ